MYRIVIVLILILSTSLTFGQQNEKTFHITEANYEAYLGLINKHHNYQTKLINNIDYFKKISADNYVFNGEDLNTINLEFSKILKLLEQSIVFQNINLATEKSISNIGNNASQKQLNSLIFTHLRIKSFGTYKLQQILFGKSIKIANLINEDNKLYRKDKNSLKRISKIIISESYRKSILNGWKIANSFNNQVLNYTANTDLIIKIKASHYYKDFLENPAKIQNSEKSFDFLIKQEKAFNKKVGFNNFLNTIVFGLSKGFGNLSGLFAFRKGKLLNNKAFIESSTKQLKPLDVILEKTPFRLTDALIPGFWSHAAIYVGNESQLKELGIWENPFIVKHHKAIKRGGFIIEALRSNVKLSTFKQFSNIDDYTHIRLSKEPSLTKKREMIIRAFAQIGKKYDFRFDLESSEKLICSELHYITFDQISYSTSTNLGRHTLSSDNIAEQALENRSFNLIDLYVDGVKIEASKRQETYMQLLTLKRKQIRKLKKSLH